MHWHYSEEPWNGCLCIISVELSQSWLVMNLQKKLQAVYRAEDVRELDRQAIEVHGVPGIRLMSRAAEAAFNQLDFIWPGVQRLAVFCGAGNNGGDGFLLAALATKKGMAATVYQLGNAGNMTGDALKAYQYAQEAGVECQLFSAGVKVDAGFTDTELVVDAMLGTGLAREVAGDYRAAIELINESAIPVLAVDIPSGLCSDTGQVLGCAVQADHTVTFIGVKQGLLTGRGPAICGGLCFDDLAVPEDIYAAVEPSAYRLNLATERQALPRRARDAHKGDNGRVLVIGGDEGFGGAALMAASAATRSGAGLVSVATQALNVPAIISHCPEVMARPVSSDHALSLMIDTTDILVLGPGLGQSSWSEELFQAACSSSKAMVVDADALNILAKQQGSVAADQRQWILTPHPGEAARLLDVSTAEIQADRFAAVSTLQKQYGGVVVLKGAGSLIADGENIYISEYGNPGMASGGMGDVLSGILGALLAQGLSLSEAARMGVCIHGAAADQAALEGGEIGLLATDLLPYVRELLNGF